MANKQSATYSKLSPSGILDNTPITQADYDVVLEYIKKSFPNANTMQRDVESTLKRTFVLGGSSSSTTTKTFSATRQNNSNNKASKKSKRRSIIKPLPRRLSYERFVMLNKLWKSYIAELLKDINENRTGDIQQKLNRIDLHGAHIEVTNANCRDFIGLRGIAIKETRNTFVLVTLNNETKTIPKAEAEFQIEMEKPRGSMIIAGNNFLTRPAERACKKIKSFMEFMGSRVYRNTLRYSNPN